MRNYKKEYENYHSRPEQKIRRAARNAARKLFADADSDKDVHHKDNNPLNNDKNNLSLVTQHYNRKEPRLRKEVFGSGPDMTAVVVKGKIVAKGSKKDMRLKYRELKKKYMKHSAARKDIKLVSAPGSKYKVGGVWKEDALSRAKERVALKKKHDAEKEAEKIAVKRASSEDTQEANAVSMSNPDAKVMIGLMQKYMNTKNPNLKIALLKKINTIQSKLGLKVTEDMGTVTGPHIAGTGDDSDTVIVKKKKKVYKREGLKNSIKALARARGR